MFPPVPGTQKKYHIYKLSFVKGGTLETDLELKGECCPDVSEQRGCVGFEFKRINLQAISWGPGSLVSGLPELGERSGRITGHLVRPQQQQ